MDERCPSVRKTPNQNRVIDRHPEELPFRFGAIGAEIPPYAHACRDRVTAELSFRLDQAAARGVMELASLGVAPAWHAYGLQASFAVDDVGNVGALTVGGELCSEVAFIRRGPRHVRVAERAGQPDIDVDAARGRSGDVGSGRIDDGNDAEELPTHCAFAVDDAVASADGKPAHLHRCSPHHPVTPVNDLLGREGVPPFELNFSVHRHANRGGKGRSHGNGVSQLAPRSCGKHREQGGIKFLPRRRCRSPQFLEGRIPTQFHYPRSRSPIVPSARM